MRFTNIAPPSSLNQYVRSFWFIEETGPSNEPVLFRPIADGCPGLLIPTAEAGFFYDQSQKQLPALCLYGQTVKARELGASGSFGALGVSLHPSALASLFGISAHELTDTCIDLRDLNPAVVTQLSSSLLNQTSRSGQLNHLITLLQKLGQRPTSTDSLINHALHELHQSNGGLSLPELHRRLNVSERGLERRFRRNVGISPKLFARICQFQASLMQLQTTGYDKLSDIAFDNGYADQSHFIRAFQEFAGCTPDQYRKQAIDAVYQPARMLA